MGKKVVDMVKDINKFTEDVAKKVDDSLVSAADKAVDAKEDLKETTAEVGKEFKEGFSTIKEHSQKTAHDISEKIKKS